MRTVTPTDEQQAVIDHLVSSPNSLVVEALAGAAKTTTITMGLGALNPRPGQVLAVAFNKKIAMDLQSKLPANVKVSTMNALGHGAWAGFCRGKLTLNSSKVHFIVRDLFEELNIQSEYPDDWLDLMKEVQSLIDGAKAMGLVPTGCVSEALVTTRMTEDSDLGWEEVADALDLDISEVGVHLAREGLKRSIKEAMEGKIDFNDQIYMSVCWGASFNQFPLVVVDEAQDLSAMNHIMLKRSLKRGGKLIAIGDRHQAIYGFRGASHNSMDQIKEMFNAEVLELNTTFRCGSEIAAHVQDWVPRITSPDWAIAGEVKTLGTNWSSETFPIGSAILCRNNAPLIRLAFALLKQGRKVTINGGELHTQLIKLLGRICGIKSKEDQNTRNKKLGGYSTDQLKEKIRAWEKAEVAALRKSGKERRVHGIKDRADCLVYLCEGAEASAENANGWDVSKYITQLFANSDGSVLLSTGHKSKGLEWDHVFHLDSHLIPSRYALMQKELGNSAPWVQEMNLRYVISTRAKKSLTYVSNEDPDAAARKR